MTIATINAFILVLIVPDAALTHAIFDPFTLRLLIATGVTTVVWVVTSLITKPESDEKLAAFVAHVKPGIGWKRFENRGTSNLTNSLLSVFVGTIGIYAALFGIGSVIYGNLLLALIMFGVFIISVYLIIKWW